MHRLCTIAFICYNKVVMPRFDFLCGKCQQTFEETLVFGETKLPTCPSCGSSKTEKLLSAPGIVFKGKGFYKTDSRSGSAASPAPKKKEPTKAENAPAKEVAALKSEEKK